MSKWADPSPQLIRRFRILAGLTLAEAAERVKTAPAVVCNWENGKHKPTAKSLTKLSKAYECDISDFYLVDIPEVRVEATSVVIAYFRNPEANIDRQASVASHLLISLPDESIENTDNPIDERSNTLNEQANQLMFGNTDEPED